MYELWLPQKLGQLAPALLLLLCSALVSAQDANADPWPVPYNTNNSIGPDGKSKEVSNAQRHRE